MCHTPSFLLATALAVQLFDLTSACAQDSLYYANGDVATGRIEEVGVDLVRYRTNSANASVLIVAEKRDLLRVKLEGGQEFVFNNVSQDVPASPEFMARRNVISLDVLAPALDHLTIGFEHSFSQHTSIVLKAGYIGLYAQDYYSGDTRNQGWLVKLGPKFQLPSSPRRRPSAREMHPLSGWYMRPELMFSYWAQKDAWYELYSSYSYRVRRTFYSSAALNLVIGRQILLGERITFDIFGGLGYGVQWRNGSRGSDYYGYQREEYAYSHAFMGYRSPLTVSGGMLFGFVF